MENLEIAVEEVTKSQIKKRPGTVPALSIWLHQGFTAAAQH
jgi:hypothetical protein